jgi:DNA-binding NarL/FixJ family response regulator
MTKTSVVIVDDHGIVCAGLKQLIDSQPDMHVIAEYTSGQQAMLALRTLKADLILLDLQLGDTSGLDVLRSVVLHTPSAKVLVTSAYPEAQYGVNVLRAGAVGFLSKSATAPEMLRAMRMVARGGRYLGATLADQLVNGLSGDLNAPLHGSLSTREFQIFCRLAQGEAVSSIANSMFLSVKTVSTYRRRVLDKMSLTCNADLTSYAMRNGLIQ